MTISGQIALAAIIPAVFVFCGLIKQKVLEWFLLILCKEHTLSRSTNRVSRNYPTFVFKSTSSFISCLCWLAPWIASHTSVMIMIITLLESHMGKLILNHLIGNNCAEFGVGLLDSYFFKLSLESDSLELWFWTVGFKTILSHNDNITKLSGLNTIGRISLSLNLTLKLSFEPRFCMFIVNGYYTKKQTLVVLRLLVNYVLICQNIC